MDIRDYGELAGRLLVFGGPYSNLEALRALDARARAAAVGGANLICTGDVVAYGGAPVATLGLVREMGAAVVAGNCERQLAAGATDCGCGFAPGSACDRLSQGWYPYALSQLGAADRDWCGRCPDIVRFRHAGKRVVAIHGGVSDIARFLWPVSGDDAFAAEVAAITAVAGPVDRVLAGHAGIAFRRQVAGVDWINAGAIGLPPNDGAPETRYVEIGADGEPVFHRLAYDHGAAAARMRDNGLGGGYADALVSGWWPSEDILPPEMRRAA